jgi:hypothetical protein
MRRSLMVSPAVKIAFASLIYQLVEGPATFWACRVLSEDRFVGSGTLVKFGKRRKERRRGWSMQGQENS